MESLHCTPFTVQLKGRKCCNSCSCIRLACCLAIPCYVSCHVSYRARQALPRPQGAPKPLSWQVCIVQALEERFNAMIEPAVSSALAARQADRVANLAMLMANAGREHELEGLYIAARLPMLQVG